MKRVVLCFCAIGALWCMPSLAAGQWSDDFDEYDTDISLHGLGGWQGWDNDPQWTAYTRDEQARSGPNSVEIMVDADLVHPYLDDETGMWKMSAWVYVPGDLEAPSDTYFIVQSTYNDGGPYTWSVQTHFEADTGLFLCDCGGGVAGASTPYVADEWAHIEVLAYFDEDWTQVFYNGVLLDDPTVADHPDLGGGYAWSTGVFGSDVDNPLDFGALDLFAYGASAVYYDDLCLVPTVPAARGDMNCDGGVTVDDIEAFSLALVDPGAYSDAYCGCYVEMADINVDGAADGNDIDDFIECIYNGSCPSFCGDTVCDPEEACETCPEDCGICPECGAEGMGDCCEDNGTPFCEQEACCDSVCGYDPWCCGDGGGIWDLICANEACEDENCFCCGNCPGDGMFVKVEIVTDFAPDQTTWELVDQATGQVVGQGGPYELPNRLYEKWVCVGDTGCYDFTIFDSAGDGLGGSASYVVYWNEGQVGSGAQFWEQESVCNIGNACPELPTCGDGTCDEGELYAEDCHDCPSDCGPCAACGSDVITQSASQDIEATSLACSPGDGTTTENNYARCFELTEDFTLRCVELGIEIQNGCRPYYVDVVISEDTDGCPPTTPGGTDLVELDRRTVVIQPGFAHDILSVNGYDLELSAGSTIVVEMQCPDASGILGLWIGANAAEPSGITYMSSDSCGMTDYMDTEGEGWPDFNWVLNLLGDTPP